jgi:hypothetical protein
MDIVTAIGVDLGLVITPATISGEIATMTDSVFGIKPQTAFCATT